MHIQNGVKDSRGEFRRLVILKRPSEGDQERAGRHVPAAAAIRLSDERVMEKSATARTPVVSIERW